MPKVLIEGSRVAQIVADGAEFAVAPPLFWTDADNTVTTDRTWENIGFDAPQVATPPTLDDIYDDVIQQQRVFRGYVFAINDGTIGPGSNMTPADIKAAVKAKM